MSRSEPKQSPRVVLYAAQGCNLCERANAQLAALRDELGFEFDHVAIDGERVCTYYVQPEPFRRKLAAAQAAGETAGL